MTRAKELPGKLSRVLAVSVNFRTSELALRCLDSLAPERGRVALEAVLVDNASGDGSVERLRAGLAERAFDWVQLVAHPTNGGFGAGNNVAVRAALARHDRPEYFLLVNPDVVLERGALGQLVDFLDHHPRVGLVGPLTQLGHGRAVGTAFRYPGILSHLDEGMHFGPLSRLLARWHLAPDPLPEPHRTDWLSGGCLLVRREVFERVGLFDEGFFLYFEEIDLTKRAEAAGFESWFVPAARIVHESGASTGVTAESALERRMPAYWFESRRRYFLKHRGALVCFLADLAWTLGNSLWNLRRLLSRAPRKEPVGFFADFVRFNLFGRELRESR